MNIRKLFEYVKDVKPHAFSEQVLLRWLSETEGKVQTEILLLSSADVITYESVMATKTITVAVAADPDHSSDRTKDTVTVTVTDVSGDCELNHIESALSCGETLSFAMKSTDDASTAASKAVEVSRAAADAVSGAGVVTVTVTVGTETPVSETVSAGASTTKDGYVDIELLVPAPYDRLYEAYLEYMIDWQEGEYNSAANTLERYNACLSEYSTWVGDNVKPGLGCAVERGYYLSAYAIAVKHGYQGTEAEWAELLIAAGENARQAHEDAASASASATAAAGSAAAAYESAYDASAAEYNASQSASAASSSAVSASGYASSASQAKTAAEAAQTASETAQGKAEAAVGHYPRISGETGNWEVWDAENEEWNDTGVNAEGDDGNKITFGTAVTTDGQLTPAGDNYGDTYVNTQTLDVYDWHQFPIISAWRLVGNMGGRGWRFGTEVTEDGQTSPYAELGTVYCNTDTYDVYAREKPSGGAPSWRYKCTLAKPVKRGTLTLSTSWTSAGSDVYTQAVTISGVTANSQIDVSYPDATVLQMIDDGVSIVKIENNAGTLTAKCIGAALTASVDVTYTLIETEAAS